MAAGAGALLLTNRVSCFLRCVGSSQAPDSVLVAASGPLDRASLPSWRGPAPPPLAMGKRRPRRELPAPASWSAMGGLGPTASLASRQDPFARLFPFLFFPGLYGFLVSMPAT